MTSGDGFVSSGKNDPVVLQGAAPDQGAEVTLPTDLAYNKVWGLHLEGSVKTQPLAPASTEQGPKGTVTVEGTWEGTFYVGGDLALKKPGLLGPRTVASVGGRALVGTRLSFETKLSPEDSKALQNGTFQMPDPAHPEAWKTGTAVVFKGQKVQGTEMEASYRCAAIEAGVKHLDGFAIGVEKLEGNKVRLLSGPVKGVENEAFAGLDAGVKFGLHNEKTLETGTLKTVELDLGTQAGKDAYYRFLATGQLPTAEDGAQNAATVQTVKLSDQTSVQASAGPFEIDWRIAGTSGERTTTTYASGAKDESLQLSYASDRTLFIDKKFGADQKLSSASYKVNMVGVDAISTQYFQQAFGQPPRSGSGSSHVEIRMTAQQSLELQAMAKDYLARTPHNVSGTASFARQLAEAKNPDEIAVVLARSQSNADLAEYLLHLRARVGKPIPGTLATNPAE